MHSTQFVILTILRAAAEQIENVAMATNHLHDFHFLNQISQVTVGSVI
jgi:hypothetical protein